MDSYICVETRTEDGLGVFASDFNEVADKSSQAETDLQTLTEYLDTILLNLPVGVQFLKGRILDILESTARLPRGERAFCL